MSDFEVHPVGTGAELAELRERLRLLEQGQARPVYRPRADTVALLGHHGLAALELELSTARALSAALGQVVHLADCKEQPLKAVPQR